MAAYWAARSAARSVVPEALSSASALAWSSIWSALASMRAKAAMAPSALSEALENWFTLACVLATAVLALMASRRPLSVLMSSTSLSCIWRIFWALALAAS